MKIVLIVDLFPPTWLAGTEIATYNIAKYLAKRHNEIHVITSLDSGFPKEEKVDHFFIHRVTFKKVRIVGVIEFWFQILLEIKRLNPDIVHVQSISTSFPGFLSKLLLKKPYIIWAQGSDVYSPSKFMKLTSELVLNNASSIIALNEHMKKEINNFCKRQDIIILPNGIELAKFRNFSQSTRQGDEEKIIAFVGTLRPVKGVEYLIKAIKIIHSKFPNTKLIIVGDGPEREKLENLVRDLNLENYICFKGHVSNQDVPRYMSKADLFILPSLSEGFPLVIAEAMALGLPIITTSVRGLPEIVKNKENGFVVEPKNSQAIAEKAILILENKELRKKIVKNNRMKAERYSWDNIVRQLEEIYCKVVKETKK